jgi:hypothetical protein
LHRDRGVPADRDRPDVNGPALTSLDHDAATTLLAEWSFEAAIGPSNDHSTMKVRIG